MNVTIIMKMAQMMNGDESHCLYNDGDEMKILLQVDWALEVNGDSP